VGVILPQDVFAEGLLKGGIITVVRESVPDLEVAVGSHVAVEVG